MAEQYGNSLISI